MRRSFVMRAALGAFILTAVWAVYACGASHLGAAKAMPMTLAVCALLIFRAIRHERAQPIALKIEPGGLSVWDRAGSLSAQGRIAGCAHWSDRLLVLALAPERGRVRTLLLAADALPPSVFRALAVLGRRAAGA
ncbi:protein YgfX [Paraburkholderia bryophila]|nr:protein YgfX [Paraburkholderia bryophila]